MGSSVNEPWVTVDEVATHLGVAKESVYRWIEGRRLPAQKLGRHWRLKLSEVDTWVRSGGASLPSSRTGHPAPCSAETEPT